MEPCPGRPRELVDGGHAGRQRQQVIAAIDPDRIAQRDRRRRLAGHGQRVVFRRRVGDEHARARPGDEIALGHQALVDLDRRCARDIALHRQPPRGGQALPAAHAAIGDRAAEERHYLVLQGQSRIALQRETAPQWMYRGPWHAPPLPRHRRSGGSRQCQRLPSHTTARCRRAVGAMTISWAIVAHPMDATASRYRHDVLAVLLGSYLLNALDRSIVSLLLEPIRREFGVSDTQLGLLSGLAFALFYPHWPFRSRHWRIAGTDATCWRWPCCCGLR